MTEEQYFNIACTVCAIGWAVGSLVYIVICIKENDTYNMPKALMSFFISPVGILPCCILATVIFLLLLFEGLPNLIVWIRLKLTFIPKNKDQ